jgi:hypothetical protein
MHDAFLVGVLQSLRRLKDASDCHGEPQRPVFPDDGREVAGLDVFHDEEMHAVRLVGVVGSHDVRVGEFGSRLHRSLKPFDRLLVLGQGGGQHLQGHHPLHAAMLSFEHLSHAALTNFVQQDVVPQHQSLRVSPVDRIGLKLGQLLLTDQFTSELLGVVHLTTVLQRLDLFRRREATVGQVLDELIDGDRLRWPRSRWRKRLVAVTRLIGVPPWRSLPVQGGEQAVQQSVVEAGDLADGGTNTGGENLATILGVPTE